mmetsp:Transcript_23734/g.40605  ORF Transcript_23734/g.40605 Transcript_23734/m.40605 type:complete len:583 (-) Transcript_23734:368-2116(-)
MLANASDDLCAAGIRGNSASGADVCCATSCGRCGTGKGCSLREIRAVGKRCSDRADVSCVLPPLAGVTEFSKLCATGIQSVEKPFVGADAVCCASSCGVCATRGCASRAGGRQKCCPRTILKYAESCQHAQNDGCLLDTEARLAGACVVGAPPATTAAVAERAVSASAVRPRAVLLAYVFGHNPRSCNAYFVRSFAALRLRRTALVVLHEETALPCQGERVDMMSYERVPNATLARLRRTGMPAAAYRLIAFSEWLQRHAATYGLAGILDTDLIFQFDIFDALHPMITGKRDVHLMAENPISTAGGCGGRSISNFTVDRLLRPTCQYSQAPPVVQAAAAPAMQRRPFWEGFGCSWLLNLGTMFGTRRGIVQLLDRVSDELQHGGRGCWDQGVLGVLAYNGALGVNITVWDYFEGLVKTLDLGAIRDAHGRLLNERGAPYAIVHQFKSKRHPAFYREMRKMFPDPWRARCNGRDPAWTARLFARPFQRVPMVDLLYEKRRSQRKEGFVHPADATARNTGSDDLRLPATLAPWPTCFTVECVARQYKSIRLEDAFGVADTKLLLAKSPRPSRSRRRRGKQDYGR